MSATNIFLCIIFAILGYIISDIRGIKKQLKKQPNGNDGGIQK